MEYFKEQGISYVDAVNKVRTLHGNRAKILKHKNIRYGGVLGMFKKDGVEVEGYINNNSPVEKTLFEDEKKKIISVASLNKNDKIDELLGKIEALDKKIESGITSVKAVEPENVVKIEKILAKNEFTHSFIKEICNRLRSELSVEQIEDFSYVKHKTLEWISECISIYDKNLSKNKIEIIVGPTGVGKTTTIAKLAAINNLGMKGEHPKSVRMINTDNYRIGAKGQIQSYGELMNIPIACIENVDEFRNKLLLYNEADLILVDTMGRSPKDYHHLAEMRELLNICGESAEIFLTLSATTKAEDLKDIINEFSSFGINALIFTKLDETSRVGNIVSILNKTKIPLIYLTDGQAVPQDIKHANKEILLQKITGFKALESLMEK